MLVKSGWNPPSSKCIIIYLWNEASYANQSIIERHCPQVCGAPTGWKYVLLIVFGYPRTLNRSGINSMLK
jgi:hypothetical protein